MLYRYLLFVCSWIPGFFMCLYQKLELCFRVVLHGLFQYMVFRCSWIIMYLCQNMVTTFPWNCIFYQNMELFFRGVLRFIPIHGVYVSLEFGIVSAIIWRKDFFGTGRINIKISNYVRAHTNLCRLSVL